jgi:hypothetical protein
MVVLCGALAGAVCGCEHTVNRPALLGFVRGDFEMTTRVEWALYGVESGEVTPLFRAQIARSIDGGPALRQHVAALQLWTNPEGGNVRYQWQVIGNTRGNLDGTTEPWAMTWFSPSAILVSSEVFDAVPRDTPRIAYVAGVETPAGVERMTINEFAGAVTNRALVLTVEWYDIRDRPNPLESQLE